MELIVRVLLGAAAGFTSALIGYFRHTPVPDFSGPKFLKTLILGAIIGGATTYMPTLGPDEIMTFLTDFGYVTVIDRVVDFIWARIKGAYNYKKGK